RVVSDLCGWEGRCGLLHEAIRADFPDLSGLQVYASGSPAMVYATLDALVEAGMAAQQMRADGFGYAPRPARVGARRQLGAGGAGFPDLSGLQVYASGSPAMVYATLDALVEAGMAAQQMRADVFAYAPRPA